MQSSITAIHRYRSDRMVQPDHPFGGLRMLDLLRMLEDEMLLELGIIVLSIVCFVVLDLYVLGCEKV
jgi:hypothetical protein